MILEGKVYNGSTIHGDAVMLSKYGKAYDGIDNKYHPNPGPDEEGYSEIERCIDWLFDRHLDKEVSAALDEWFKVRVAIALYDTGEDIDKVDPSEVIKNVLFSDTYTLCQGSIDKFSEVLSYFSKNPTEIDEYARLSDYDSAKVIATYINEKFLRVRAGGKLNPEGTDTIYFRISSHGYDWHRNISDYLWDTFEDPKKMPKKIWIGHDAETNPPEITLFEGTPSELFDSYDNKVFESTRPMNQDRKCDYLNKLFRNSCKGTYKAFR